MRGVSIMIIFRVTCGWIFRVMHGRVFRDLGYLGLCVETSELSISSFSACESLKV